MYIIRFWSDSRHHVYEKCDGFMRLRLVVSDSQGRTTDLITGGLLQVGAYRLRPGVRTCPGKPTILITRFSQTLKYSCGARLWAGRPKAVGCPQSKAWAVPAFPLHTLQTQHLPAYMNINHRVFLHSKKCLKNMAGFVVLN
jgi:hypothetical protein